MQILHATIAAAAEILQLQKLAYQSEAKRYNNYNIPPLKQTIDEIKQQFKNHIILKATDNNKIIGTVSAYEKDGTCFIGRLAVSPQNQNQGIGTALMNEIEKCFNVRRFELFVGAKSENNIRLYRKLGYVTFKTGRESCVDIKILFMEKIK